MAAVGMVRHLRNYASAGIMSAIVGLVSFPILTRNLSVAEYGIVGLITSSLALFLAVGKLGFQHSVIRYFSQIKSGNIDYNVNQMNSTVAAVFFAFACGTTFLWLLSGLVVLPVFLQYENISSLFLLASVIVFMRLLGSGAVNFLRAQQRSADVAISQSLSRFLNLALIICVLFLSTLSPWTVISCLAVAEMAGVSYAIWQYMPDFAFNKKDISGKLAKAMLMYGLPLMILESLGLVLRLSDRYLIESMLGVTALGQYSASYNFASYIDIIILAAVVQAVKPAYLHMWESEGKVATQAFLAQGIQVYLVVGIPFIAIFSLTSPHVLSILAGEKYAPGTVVIPWIAVSYLLEGAVHFLAAGLYIYKNTKVLMFWSFIATVVNLALNFIFIPLLGIVGAALVTILSYIIFMLGVSSLAFRHVDFPLSWRSPTYMLVASVLVYVVLNQLELDSDVIDCLLKGAIATVTLLGVLWLVDSDVRRWLLSRVARLSGAE